jgi:hypothetical protein
MRVPHDFLRGLKHFGLHTGGDRVLTHKRENLAVIGEIDGNCKPWHI